MGFRLPNDGERATIIGRTGSGKTVAALWQLSLRSYDKKPWYIFDFKGDKNIAAIPKLQQKSLSDTVARKPGLYVVRPLPNELDAVDDLLWRIWHRERIGLYFDEGYMVNKSAAFQALLTQGRSKLLPMIVLTQRPSWLNRFVWSESEFFQLFSLSNEQDRKTVSEIIPGSYVKLPAHHSQWYDVAADRKFYLHPVPKMSIIHTTFRDRQLKLALL